jgi:protein TonB
MTRADGVCILIAATLHAAVAFVFLRARPQPRGRSPVEFDIRRRPDPVRPPSPVAPGTPEPVRPPLPRKLVRAPSTPPAPNRTPPAAPPPAPAPPPRPVFGVSMDSTTDRPSSFSVPTGNTTMIDPAQSALRDGVPDALPAARPGDATAPPGVLSIKNLPEVDTEACGRSIRYPKEAQELGVEGDVRLSVSLDERGHVLSVRVLSGLGHGLDAEAVRALTHHCRFTPAIGSDGRPLPFVIAPYVFHFEIPR